MFTRKIWTEDLRTDQGREVRSAQRWQLETWTLCACMRRHHLAHTHKGRKLIDKDRTSSPMSPRIVSWKSDEPRVSPSLSSASSLSIVSMNSIGSETHMMTTEATGVQPADPGAKLAYFPGCVKPTTDESFVRHNIYFFKDGNITFLVRVTPCIVRLAHRKRL